MNIKGLLIGSAAALVSVSGAKAADAIIAAEPEAVEYVRVCDAFGTGYFYIPGTETCLKIGGYVRFQTNFGKDVSGKSDWDAFTRAQVELDARTETEIGTVRSFIALRGEADNASSKNYRVSAATGGGSNNISIANGDRNVWVDQAFIEVGGLRVGKFYSWWDDSLSGETDDLSYKTNFNSIRYIYDNGSFNFGVSVDELEGSTNFVKVYTNANAITSFKTYDDNNVGISANLGVTMGGVDFNLLGGYDTDRGEGSVRAMMTAAVGPGTFGLAGLYTSGANTYFAAAEWVVSAEYAFAVTDRLTLTPGVQWYSNVGVEVNNSIPGLGSLNSGEYIVSNGWSDWDAWKAGLTIDYAITSGLAAKASVQYIDVDQNGDAWSGFLRLQRNF